MEDKSFSKKTEQVCFSSFKGGIYEIRVQGQLDISWSDWFEGLLVTTEGDSETVLSGYIVDQAALHSVLSKLYRLNLPLLSVKRG